MRANAILFWILAAFFALMAIVYATWSALDEQDPGMEWAGTVALSLTRQMQADYAPHGIRVNALLPGTIHTPFVDRYLVESYDDPVAGLQTIKQRQLTGELGKPEDVAAAALFLASDESSFVLGSGLFVDGGVRGAR